MLSSIRFFLFIIFILSIAQPTFSQTAPSNLVTINITFATPPGTATVVTTDLKYNKEAVINIEWDDNSPDCMTALPLLNAHYFTDGCGNNRSYRAALAINGLNNYNNAEWGNNYPGKTSYTQMQTLTAAGWDIENHSEYHEPSGNFSNGTDAMKNVTDLTQRLWNNTGYLMSTVVVPSNYAGFVTAARDLDYLAATTQGQKDGIAIYPAETWHKYTEVGLLPTGFVQLNREFTDDWTGYLPTLKTRVDEILSGSSTSVHKFYRIGSHTLNATAFTDYLDYLQTNAADRIWVTTMRELLEYRLVKQQMIKTENLSGNVLTVTLDLSNVSNKVRFRDMTFLVNAGAAISNIAVSGTDSSSWNATNNLINIFNQRNTYSNPSALTLPVRWLSFTATSAAGTTLLHWKTAGEDKAAWYEPQRSTDGKNFSALQRMPAQQGLQNSYTASDKSIAAGTSYYYRIRQMDNDGQDNYSAIRSLRIHAVTSPLLKVKNTVFTDQLTMTITTAAGSTIQLALVNADGHIVRQQQVQTTGGQNTLTLPTSSLPAGLYTLTAQNATQHAVLKVIKH